MRSNPPDVGPEWIWVLLNASRLLAVGSGFLLLASVLVVAPEAIAYLGIGLYGFVGLLMIGFGFVILTVLGVLVHLVGWSALSEGASQSLPMRTMFFVSVGGFVASVIYALIVLVPAPGYFLLFGGWIIIPYTPIVYGPVVIAHAAIFLLGLERLRRGPASHLIIVGSGVLVAIGIAGLSLQASITVFRFPSDVSLVLAGVTSVGYGLIAVGLQRHYEEARTPMTPESANGTQAHEPFFGWPRCNRS